MVLQRGRTAERNATRARLTPYVLRSMVMILRLFIHCSTGTGVWSTVAVSYLPRHPAYCAVLCILPQPGRSLPLAVQVGAACTNLQPIVGLPHRLENRNASCGAGTDDQWESSVPMPSDGMSHWILFSTRTAFLGWSNRPIRESDMTCRGVLREK